ncbi:MAG: hypothetical protein AB7T59_05840 [Hyphomonadaceae bacterium]
MFDLKFSKSAFVADLTAAKSTSITAAAVLIATFLPMTGGAIKPYELSEFRAGVAALMNGETSTPSLYPVRHPDWGGNLVNGVETATPRLRQVAYAGRHETGDARATETGLNADAVLTVAQAFEGSVDDASDEQMVELPMLEEADVVQLPAIENAIEFAPLAMG